MSRPLPKDPRRIALWAGELNLRDKILVSALFNVMHELYPLARIDLIAHPDTLEFYRAAQAIDQVVSFVSEQSFWQRLRHSMDFVAVLRDKKYDMVVLMTDEWDHVLAARRAGIAYRVGFRGHPLSILLSHPVARPAGVDFQPEFFLQLATPVTGGRLPEREQFTLGLQLSAQDRLRLLLKEHRISAAKRLILVSPCNPFRRDIRYPAWLPEAVSKLQKRIPNSVVAAVGEEEDAPDCARFARAFPGRCQNLAGRLNHLNLALLADHARLLVGMDPDYLLLADALGRAFVGLFHHQDWNTRGPVNAAHQAMIAEGWERDSVLGITARNLVSLAVQALAEHPEQTTPRGRKTKRTGSKKKTTRRTRTKNSTGKATGSKKKAVRKKTSAAKKKTSSKRSSAKKSPSAKTTRSRQAAAGRVKKSAPRRGPRSKKQKST